MDNRLIVLLFLVGLLELWALPQFPHNTMDHKQKFCGPHLANTLSLICQSNYNSPQKKSSNDWNDNNQYDQLFSASGDENEYLDFPFLQKEGAFDFLPMRERRRSQIINECCEKPCSYRHLALYCA